jgi:tetratricopeptide (TPR) repeat protein
MALCACTWVLGARPRVVAQDGSVEVPGYREAIDEALAEYAIQNYLEAMSLFARAHKISPNARTLRGLGSVTFELRRYSESVMYLEQALASEQKRLDPKMRAETERLLSRARGYVAELKLEVEPNSAQVVLDGARSALMAGQPLLLDIGKHELEFSATGRVTERRSYTVIGGESATWRISLRQQPSTSSAGPQVSVPPPLLRWHKALGATAIAVGIASIATAGVLTAHRHGEAKHFRAVDPASDAYPEALRAWGDTRPKPYALASAGAIAFTSGAIGLFLRAPDRPLVRVGAGISAMVGVVLATLGTIELLRGSGCEVDLLERQKCSGDLERRDRGAITLLAAFPLVVPPIALLFRNWLGQPRATVTVSSAVDPKTRSISFSLRREWL